MCSLAFDLRVLRLAADARHRLADVNGRADTSGKKFLIKIDLTVGDGDQVGGDVRGDLPLLCLDDRQRGETAAAVLGRQAGGPLQQPRMQIKDVAGVGLAARRTAQQQRQFTVGAGVAGEIIVDHQAVAPLAHPVFANGTAGVGGEIFHSGQCAALAHHHGGIFQRTIVAQQLEDIDRRGAFLPHHHIDTDHIFAALVDDCVQRDAGAPQAFVTNNQLALTPANGQQAVDQADAGIERPLDEVAFDHWRRRALQVATAVAAGRRLAIERLTEGVDNPPQQRFAHRHADAEAAELNRGAGGQSFGLAQQHRAEQAFTQVKYLADTAVGEVE